VQDDKNLTIGVLSITAVVLLIGVILTAVGGQNQALAIGQSDRGGDYIVVTGQFTQSTELVYVTDAAARRLNLYSYDATRRQLILWDSQDLRRVFGKPRGRP
jgi:hypothetical protein